MKGLFWRIWAVVLVLSVLWLGWAIRSSRPAEAQEFDDDLAANYFSDGLRHAGGIDVADEIVVADEILSRIEKPDEHRLKELKKSIKKKRDEMTGITWYLPLEDSQFKLYIAKADYAPPLLRFKAVTHGGDWVFFEKILVLADEKRFITNIDPLDRQSDVVVDEDWFNYPEVQAKEWIDVPVGMKGEVFSLEDFIHIACAEKVKVRFAGENYYRERKLKKAETNALYDVLQYYIWVLTDIGENSRKGTNG